MKIGDRVMLIGESIDKDRLGLIVDESASGYTIVIGDEKIEVEGCEIYPYGATPDEKKIEIERWVKHALGFGPKFTT